MILCEKILIQPIQLYYSLWGLLKSPARTKAGYRIYYDASVDKLMFESRSREIDFTIEECR